MPPLLWAVVFLFILRRPNAASSRKNAQHLTNRSSVGRSPRTLSRIPESSRSCRLFDHKKLTTPDSSLFCRHRPIPYVKTSLQPVGIFSITGSFFIYLQGCKNRWFRNDFKIWIDEAPPCFVSVNSLYRTFSVCEFSRNKEPGSTRAEYAMIPFWMIQRIPQPFYGKDV